MLELQQRNSFNAGLFFVLLFIHCLLERAETLGYDSFNMACLTLRRLEKI